MLTWIEAEGVVDQYLIRYTKQRENIAFNITIPGSLTSYSLTGLTPGTTYSVVILTLNSNGISPPSPQSLFTTDGKLRIYI